MPFFFKPNLSDSTSFTRGAEMPQSLLECDMILVEMNIKKIAQFRLK